MRYTFIHLRGFGGEALQARLSNEDLRRIENEIVARPLAWPVMTGTGGVRKMRYAPQSGSRGKKRGCLRLLFSRRRRRTRLPLECLFQK